MLASIDDINAHLPAPTGMVVTADNVNAQLLQISVERVVRGYLSRILTTATMAGWDDPESTPDIIREVAGMLIASQLLLNQISASSLNVDNRNYAQILYDRAIALLNDIIEGSIIIPDVIVDTPESMTDLNFFPVDDTDRAFTMGMNL